LLYLIILLLRWAGIAFYLVLMFGLGVAIGSETFQETILSFIIWMLPTALLLRWSYAAAK